MIEEVSFQEATFLRLVTSMGETIEMTPLHFIWKVFELILFGFSRINRLHIDEPRPSSFRSSFETYLGWESAIHSTLNFIDQKRREARCNFTFFSQVNCDAPKFNIELTHAEKILPGDCLYTLNAKKGENYFIYSELDQRAQHF